MLEHLHIKNVALIAESELHFEKGLNILTGETGAGKSMIIDSLHFALGGRVNRDFLRKEEQSAVVEALFSTDNPKVSVFLEENGIHAEHVKDGALCLKAVQNAPEDYYNVILMDIQMPNMNGYQAAEAIRALPGKRGEIPIVAMTANAFEEDRRKALESGMNAHIAKPVDVSVLLETLSRFS